MWVFVILSAYFAGVVDTLKITKFKMFAVGSVKIITINLIEFMNYVFYMNFKEWDYYLFWKSFFY